MFPKPIVLAILATCGWAYNGCSMQGTCPSHKGESLLQLDKAVDRLQMEKTVESYWVYIETDRTPVPCKKGDVVKFAPATEPDNCMLPKDNYWQLTPCNTEESPGKEDILFIANKDCEWELKSKPGKCGMRGSESATETCVCGTKWCEKLKLMKQTLSDGVGATKTGLILVLGELAPRPSWATDLPSYVWDNRCLAGGTSEYGTFIQSGTECVLQPENVFRGGEQYWKVYKITDLTTHQSTNQQTNQLASAPTEAPTSMPTPAPKQTEAQEPGCHCSFQFENTLMTWADANADCVSKGMHLAVPQYLKENRKVMKACDVSLGVFKSCWLGGQTFKLSTGDDILIGWKIPAKTKEIRGFKYWDRNEPNGVGGGVGCIEMYGKGCPGCWDGKWNDVACDESRPYVCENTSKACC